jgi:quercetin dioxygenase-like cupin family protein
LDSSSAQKVTVIPPGAGETASIPGFGAVYKLYSRDTGGEVAIVEHPFAVGTITPPHRHTREDEHSIVLEGQVGFRSDEDEVVLGPGGYITKPRGQTHAMWNAGQAPARIIEVITPGGFEGYFRELSELLMGGEASGAFARLAAKYGMTYEDPDWYGDVVARYRLTRPAR